MPRANRSKKAESSGRFKPYPAYKDSGVEWLGKIPSHWDVKRLKYAAPARTTRLERKPDDTAYLGLENIESWTGRLLLASAPESVDSVVATFESGDVLFSKLRPYLAKVARPRFGGVCTSEVVPLRPLVGMSQDYVMYGLLNAPYIYWLDSLTYGTKMPRVSPDQLATSPFAVPPVGEQRAIAAFLDRETARIDALVAKKERLIELLREERSALITRAVTKGLDPNVPLKDSGVEWVGEMPEHWEVVRSIRLFSQSKVRALDGDQQLSATQKYGVIPQAEFERLEARQVVHVFMHLDQRKHVDVDDFVMSMRSFEGGLERVRARGCVRSSYTVLKASSAISAGFFAYLFKCDTYIQALRATSSFIRDGQDLNYENFRQVPLPLADLEEQQAIAAFLDKQTARIDALVAKSREAIDRLREHRIALISAAVTGKIDVRGMVDGATSEGGAA